MNKRIHQFSALSARQKRALLLAWLALPAFHIGLQFRGLARVHAWVLRRTLRVRESPGRFGLTLQDAQGLGYAVNAAAKFPKLNRACLRRSLVLLWVLRRNGVEAQLCIGVRFLEGALDAHAWVEWLGQPVNDRPDVGRDFASFGEFVPVQAFHSA